LTGGHRIPVPSGQHDDRLGSGIAAAGDSGAGYGKFYMITFGTIILLLVTIGVLWLVYALAAARTENRLGRRSGGLQALEERYARGEIDRDEYLEKKRDISG
jgi:putative membrane protein